MEMVYIFLTHPVILYPFTIIQFMALVFGIAKFNVYRIKVYSSPRSNFFWLQSAVYSEYFICCVQPQRGERKVHTISYSEHRTDYSQLKTLCSLFRVPFRRSTCSGTTTIV